MDQYIYGTPRVRVEAFAAGLLLAVPLLLIGEFAVLDYLSAFAKNGGTFYQPRIWLDDRIPFVPAFIIPYWLYFPIVFLLCWIPETRKEILQVTGSLLILNALCYSIFVLFPSSMTRPEITCDSVACGFAGAMYLIDPGYAVMPSLHVGNSVLATIFFFSSKHKWRFFVLSWACCIIISTLFVRQHYILDLPAGAITAIVVAWGGWHGLGWLWDRIADPQQTAALAAEPKGQSGSR